MGSKKGMKVSMHVEEWTNEKADFAKGDLSKFCVCVCEAWCILFQWSGKWLQQKKVDFKRTMPSVVLKIELVL